MQMEPLANRSPIDAAPPGLTAAQAQRRLQEIGPNAMASEAGSPWRRVLSKFWAPVPWMLEAAIVLQVATGEYIEAAVIGCLLVFNALLGILQESRAQATLEALKSRLALVASVRRDGVWLNVPAANLVPGDIVKLSLGGIVPADVRLLQGQVLLDQSTLTGESLPIDAGLDVQTFAGALVRRGEAVAEVVATGERTKFGRTAELVRTAHVVSAQQKAVLRVVRNLALFNGGVVIVQVAYALHLKLPPLELIPLALTAVLAAIPVALPATFTLATALGSRALAGRGVLPTRLSAIDEAAAMDVLCADKTGTLTQNQLAVAAIWAASGFQQAQALALAALASSEGGQDPVDAAIRARASGDASGDAPKLLTFTPFDPANKMSEAMAVDSSGRTIKILKGAFATVSALAAADAPAVAAADALQAQGYRVLAVAAGPEGAPRLVGLIALSDPPRPDSAALIEKLRDMGVRTVMATGDSAATAAVVAHAVGLDGPVCPPGTPPATLSVDDFAVYAGVFPEDKFHIVKALQAGGHTVGMCGDGANDAPALRQAQVGIAVSTATDVAKSAAGLVLTEPGLAGILAAVQEGRVTFQRILTYTLRSMTHKIDQMLFLTVGLIMTGHAILSPLLMVILMTTGDFLSMSSTTDNVRPSPKPDAWRIDSLTVAGIVFGVCDLILCSSVLAIGAFGLGLAPAALQTLSAVILVFSSQAVFFVVRERRRLWSSAPSKWLIVSSAADVTIISSLAISGTLMAPLPVWLIGCLLAAAAVFAFILDAIKAILFARLRMA